MAGDCFIRSRERKEESNTLPGGGGGVLIKVIILISVFGQEAERSGSPERDGFACGTEAQHGMKSMLTVNAACHHVVEEDMTLRRLTGSPPLVHSLPPVRNTER